jgi:hypothetical protein
MGRIGITIEFINMVKILLSWVETIINLNDITTRSFEIKRGIYRHACPLAPYIFLIMKKVLNVIIKCVAKEGKIQGIKLPIRQ